MANIKANIKAKRKSDKRNISNKARISALKTWIKKARNNNGKDLNTVYQLADSLSRKHIIHRNKANRIKSRLALAINKTKNKPNNNINK